MSPVAQIAFWTSLVAIAYPYAIYPAVISGWNRITGRRMPRGSRRFEPSVTVVCPVHNEAASIAGRIENLLAARYPPDRLEILIVGDGCTDATLDIARNSGGGRAIVVVLETRRGKAAALNAGVERASGEVIVFTDASIRSDPDALAELVKHFANPVVGCVSGEDWIEGASAEGLYGRLELALRREEARLHSIAGASGCLYAMRRQLCRPFPAGMAPDFFSVLDTVRMGYRAIAESAARGTMTAARTQTAEFSRKCRTILRGVTALAGNAALLNPFRHPAFSFILVSHKLLRWIGPIALVGCLAAAFALRDVAFYRAMLHGQLLLYAMAIIGILMPRAAEISRIVRACAYFVLVNLAAAVAVFQWAVGVRQEVWEPTRRSA